jgi:hypothetical protein
VSWGNGGGSRLAGAPGKVTVATGTTQDACLDEGGPQLDQALPQPRRQLGALGRDRRLCHALLAVGPLLVDAPGGKESAQWWYEVIRWSRVFAGASRGQGKTPNASRHPKREGGPSPSGRHQIATQRRFWLPTRA